MSWFSSDDDRTKEEKDLDAEQHRAYRKAGNQAAKAHRDEHLVHHMLSEAVAETEQHVPWWRR